MPERLAPTRGVGLPNGVHSSITPSTLRDVRGAVECWQPDVGCIAAGDHHIELAVRCWAAAMLSDYQISKRWSVSVARDQLGGVAVDGRFHTKF